MSRIDDLIQAGEVEAAKIGFIPPRLPDWHPYFWAGWIAALKSARDTNTISPKTAKALAELRRGAKPDLDPEALAIVKADVKKLYGWDWPDGMDLEAGATALFDYLREKANR